MYWIGTSSDSPKNYIEGGTREDIDILARLQWTTEAPTQEGWYWAIIDEKCVIVEAFYMTVEKFGCLNFRTGWNSVDESSVARWLGPISYPEMPE